LKSFVLKTKRGSRNRAPATGGQWGFMGKAPNAAAILQLFFKRYAFLGIIWSKFRVFKWLNKVLMRPQGFCPGALPLFAPLMTLLGEKAKIVHLLSLLCYSILTLNQINILT